MRITKLTDKAHGVGMHHPISAKIVIEASFINTKVFKNLHSLRRQVQGKMIERLARRKSGFKTGYDIAWFSQHVAILAKAAINCEFAQ